MTIRRPLVLAVLAIAAGSLVACSSPQSAPSGPTAGAVSPAASTAAVRVISGHGYRPPGRTLRKQLGSPSSATVARVTVVRVLPNTTVLDAESPTSTPSEGVYTPVVVKVIKSVRGGLAKSIFTEGATLLVVGGPLTQADSETTPAWTPSSVYVLRSGTWVDESFEENQGEAREEIAADTMETLRKK